MYYLRSYMKEPSIVSIARGDVNGDGIIDNIYLTGIQTMDSPFIQNITLLVQDGRTGQYNKTSLSENAGYNPSLILEDFTGNGVVDILISIATGGSGGIMYYYIYSFINNVARLLFDVKDYNNEYQYEVTYKDDYKVEVISKENKQIYIIDISMRDSGYLQEIYDKNGHLKQPIQGFVNPLSGLYPVDFDSDGIYDLLAYQKIAGRYNADSLGYVLNNITWNETEFILDNQYVAIFGSDFK